MMTPSSTACAAIVLAAGSSTRFGANKLLQPFRGGCVLGAVLAAATAARARPLVIVTGHAAAAVTAAIEGALGDDVPYALVHNPEHASGEMASSIKVGVAWLLANAPRAQGALVVPGDMPLLSAAVMDRVAAAGGAAGIAAPRHRGQRGHPVYFGRAVWPEVLALRAGAQMRALLAARAGAIRWVDVDDPGILVDVDTPEALRAAERGDYSAFS